MFKNLANLHYVMGFVIVIVLLYIGMQLYTMTHSARYHVNAENTAPRVGITILTNKGPLNLDRSMMDHYLNRLKENLKFLSKRVDPERCAHIKNQLLQARESLKSQIAEHSESGNVQKDQMNDERAKLRSRIDAMSDIMFSNDQNSDDARSIILEMVLDLETILYLTKIIPSEIESIDVRDVDQISKLIYEQACIPIENVTSTEDEMPNEDNRESPFEDAFVSVQKKRPGPFETYVDFNKNQNLRETRVGTSSYNPNFKTRKENLSNIRKTSMGLANTTKEKYEPLITRKVPISKQAKGTDPIRDRVAQAKEEFISSQPHRYQKTKNSLVEDYNYIEDSTVFPGLAFTW